jgi:hypothetical protein
MMSTVFHYEQKVVIKRSRNVVIDEFLNYENMKKWQPTLHSVELVKGKWKEENHKIHLTYVTKAGDQMLMEESIESMSLPHKIINTYRVGTTFNRNSSYFESFGADTMWTMEVEFHFEGDVPTSQLSFERQTRQSMKEFKKYVEAI